MTTTLHAPDVPVIAIWPVTDELRAAHGLPAEASAAVVEVFHGTVEVRCTDLDTPRGIKAAAQTWAEYCGAAYAGAA